MPPRSGGTLPVVFHSSSAAAASSVQVPARESRRLQEQQVNNKKEEIIVNLTEKWIGRIYSGQFCALKSSQAGLKLYWRKSFKRDQLVGNWKSEDNLLFYVYFFFIRKSGKDSRLKASKSRALKKEWSVLPELQEVTWQKLANQSWIFTTRIEKKYSHGANVVFLTFCMHKTTSN